MDLDRLRQVSTHPIHVVLEYASILVVIFGLVAHVVRRLLLIAIGLVRREWLGLLAIRYHRIKIFTTISHISILSTPSHALPLINRHTGLSYRRELGILAHLLVVI